MNSHEAALWLKERDNFLIVTHRRPDGDTLGCAAGLAEGLRGAGKTAFILFNPEATARYVPYVQKHWAPDGFTPSYVIAVDIASPGLFPDNWQSDGSDIALCIDHHPSNTGYAQATCLDTGKASCGEIIYEILTALTGRISADTAAALYVAVSTDTGCFAYSNTNASAHHVAGALVDAGAPIGEINKVLFRTKAKSRVLIEADIISGMEFYYDGAVAIATITRDMMKNAGAGENEMDDIAALANEIEGVIAGITIREITGPGDCKVSIRTTPLVNANLLASRFGGGGHAMASGFSLDMAPGEVKKQLLAALSEIFPLKKDI
jgi:phosphoesterase RecJ-like protein